MDAALEPLFDSVADPTRLKEWRTLVLGRSGNGDGWTKLTASPVSLKDGPAIRVVTRIGRREETQVLSLDAWPARLLELASETFERAHVQASSADWHARLGKKGKWLVTRAKPSAPAGDLPEHDRDRRYPLPPDETAVRRLLVATGLFSPQGNLRASHADKYRQVQHYVELVRPLPIWDAAGREHRPLRIVDAGCGKAYMSLALYVYGGLQGVPVELVGLDSEPEVVEKVRVIARDLGYERARFEATGIWEFAERSAEPVDLLVSLHACDTATDEAIAAGVRLGAGAIVVAPCCHREVSRQMRGAEAWRAPLRHGILRRRLADVVTDSLRAAALEAVGYKADVIEFVAAEHTAKNVMVRATLHAEGKTAAQARARGKREYEALAGVWGVTPTIGRLLADRWPT